MENVSKAKTLQFRIEMSQRTSEEKARIRNLVKNLSFNQLSQTANKCF